jgi:hypothetical protein
MLAENQTSNNNNKVASWNISVNKQWCLKPINGLAQGPGSRLLHAQVKDICIRVYKYIG